MLSKAIAIRLRDELHHRRSDDRHKEPFELVAIGHPLRCVWARLRNWQSFWSVSHGLVSLTPKLNLKYRTRPDQRQRVTRAKERVRAWHHGRAVVPRLIRHPRRCFHGPAPVAPIADDAELRLARILRIIPNNAAKEPPADIEINPGLEMLPCQRRQSD